MREIEFRGKSHNGEWFYGDLLTYESGRRSIRRVSDWHTQDVIPETVGQFAGLFDKNGMKIFEGDTVMRTIKRKNIPDAHKKAKVIYFASSFILEAIGASGKKINFSNANLMEVIND